MREFHIAGLSIRLSDLDECLADLDAAYAQFQTRCDEFKANDRNPHLCRAGCSHCCRRGAFFAVTLAEAVCLSRAVDALPFKTREASHGAARALLQRQTDLFPLVPGAPDQPGKRSEESFTARVSRVSQEGPCCPLLKEDMCGVYQDRPLLCRAYGFPVDAYAVKADSAIVFRSLCYLYEGLELADYVRAKDLKERVNGISLRLGGERNWGRFTSAEAILAHVVPTEPAECSRPVNASRLPLSDLRAR